MTGSTSRGAFLFGFLACLFLAPVPLIPGPAPQLRCARPDLRDHGVWPGGRGGPPRDVRAYRAEHEDLHLAVGSVLRLRRRFGHSRPHRGRAPGTRWHRTVSGSFRTGQSLVGTRRLPAVSRIWRRTFAMAGIAIGATIVWGALPVTALVAVLRLGRARHSTRSGAKLYLSRSWLRCIPVIVVAWFMVRTQPSIEADLYLGTTALLVTGALLWGAHVDDLLAAHLLVAGIAVFATPAAAVAVWSIWLRLRAAGHARFAVAVWFCAARSWSSGSPWASCDSSRLDRRAMSQFRSRYFAEIRGLPLGAKLAYACRASEEVAFWEARLLSLDAHTGRRIVPMCFQAEVTSSLTQLTNFGKYSRSPVPVGAAARLVCQFGGPSVGGQCGRLSKDQTASTISTRTRSIQTRSCWVPSQSRRTMGRRCFACPDTAAVDKD